MKDSVAPSAPSQWLRLYTSAPYGCSYLATETARMQVLDPQAVADTAIYAELIEQGFRRSGLSIYRPSCERCQRCLPLRVPVHTFHPNRSQRRAIKQHAALQVRLLPLVFQAEHYTLYQQYQQQRHGDGNSDGDADSTYENSEQAYRDFILSSPVDSFLAEFRTPTEQLKVVALIDRLPQALSAVYTFYANDFGASSAPTPYFGKLRKPATGGCPTFTLVTGLRTAPRCNTSRTFSPASCSAKAVGMPGLSRRPCSQVA